MFGNKKAKDSRIDQIIYTLLHVDHEHPNQQQLSQRFGVSPKTIAADLVVIEKRGILLWEDPQGGLGIFDDSDS